MKTSSFTLRRHALLAVAAVVVLGLARAALAQTLYVSCGTAIDKVTSDGTVTSFVTGLSSGLSGLAFDSGGNLYAASQGGGVIYKITPTGSVSTFASIYNPIGLAFDSSGNLYAAGFNDGAVGYVYQITPGGVVTTFADNNLSAPLGLAFDSSGNLYATKANSKIVELAPNNNGGAGTNIVNSGLLSPYGLAFNSADNNLYTGNPVGTIYKVTTAGAVTTFVNTGSANYLIGIASDSSGNLFAAVGSGGNKILEITPTGTVTTFASLSGPSFIAVAPVPEPSTYALVASLAALGFVAWRRRGAGC
jgi:sugar lactone lactonase YvrE